MKQATPNIRTIDHADHTDIERLFYVYSPDGNGGVSTSAIWAVVWCGLKQEKQAMTNATRRLKIIEGLGYKVDSEMIARENKIDEMGKQYRIRDEIIVEVTPMLGLLQSAVAGTFTVDDNGVDAVDAQRWQDENPCVACSARHGCKSFCQVRKQYQLNNRWQLNAIAEEADSKDWQDQTTQLRNGG